MKFPEPPSARDLAAIPPAIRILDAGTLVWRIYSRGGQHPVSWSQFRNFGPVKRARFDHHRPPPREQDRSILYGGMEIMTCLAEVFQELRQIDRDFLSPWLAGFALAEPIRLLDLTGTWPTAAGTSMAVSTGPRGRAQRWSRAIYDAYPDIQGLYYPSSMHANRPAVALFERALPALPHHPQFNRPLSDPILFVPLTRAATTLRYRLRPVIDIEP